MPLLKNSFKIKCVVVVLVSFCLCVGTWASKVFAEKPILKDSQWTVVIDPGHGGHDPGAKGPGGSNEKTVVLALSRMIAAGLGDRYRVILTRTDDYHIDSVKRTSMANQVKSDLFISIHTGGSSLHKAGGMAIYVYRKISKDSHEMDLMATDPFKNEIDKPLWDEIQLRHVEFSRMLAGLVRKGLQDQHIGIACNVEDVPVLVLSGANMPAILIEIGYITNPAEENLMNDEEFLTLLANGIGSGIDAFFQDRPIKSPKRLQE